MRQPKLGEVVKWVVMSAGFVACNQILGVPSEHHLVTKDAGSVACTPPNDCPDSSGPTSGGGRDGSSSGGTVGTGGAPAMEGSGASSAGGSGGAPGSGGAATGGADGGSGDGSALGGLGNPCPKNGASACDGHAPQQQLVCVNHVWGQNGKCTSPANYNCDSTPGPTAGTCQPVVAECIGKQPGNVVCQGMNRVKCGPDLVTTTPVDTCATGTQTCTSAGVCVACGAGTANCDGNATDCETNLNAVATCGTTCANKVACKSQAPACSAGVCVPPSCSGLASNCGPSSNESCCASPLVTGGTFYRSYDGVTSGYTSQAYPATVSNFLLDKYEITVGRFRKFVAAYSQTMIAAGAGKNPNNASDPGWDVTWNTSLPADAATLTSTSYVQCSATSQTWTPSAGANENKPINCIDWYEANAFCIWDGGRLPTEAEWNYAAAGGTDQRVYPWGSTAPDCTYANFYGAAGGTDYCVVPGTGSTNNVGSESPKGNGKYGQADLAGNVWEWTLDRYASPYAQTLCINCANTAAATNRVLRGGGFFNDASYLLSSYRLGSSPSGRSNGIGSRCARTP